MVEQHTSVSEGARDGLRGVRRGSSFHGVGAKEPLSMTGGSGPPVSVD